MTDYAELVAQHIRQHVEHQLLHGFGDTSAPLAEGEYVHAAIACPHEGCDDWMLPIEWRLEGTTTTTRLRGAIERAGLCQDHLEQHVRENYRLTP